MNIPDMCMGCMNAKQNEDICKVCGWDNGVNTQSILHLQPGTILKEHYLIGRVLGHGGFGVTYIAWDMNLDVKLAIKEYLPHDFATRSSQYSNEITIYSSDLKEQYKYGLEKFLDEAKALAKFDAYPGIVSIRDFFKENGTAYFVMNYIEGCTLKEYLRTQGGRISFQEAIGIMMPVMDSLREVHSMKLLHRDISPDNIYITKEGTIKILDFGAARYSTSEHSQSLSVVLKPGYAPPEQYQTNGNQGQWTDVYSAGATMYKMITGQIPPESLERMDVDIIKTPLQLGIEMPEHSEKALMKALSFRISERYQSIDDFQRDLISTTYKLDENPINIIEKEIASKENAGHKNDEGLELGDNKVNKVIFEKSINDKEKYCKGQGLNKKNNIKSLYVILCGVIAIMVIIAAVAAIFNGKEEKEVGIVNSISPSPVATVIKENLQAPTIEITKETTTEPNQSIIYLPTPKPTIKVQQKIVKIPSTPKTTLRKNDEKKSDKLKKVNKDTNNKNSKINKREFDNRGITKQDQDNKYDARGLTEQKKSGEFDNRGLSGGK